MKIGYGKPFQMAAETTLGPRQAQEAQVAGEQVTEQVAEQVNVQVLSLLRDLVAKKSRKTIFVTSQKWSPSKRSTGEVRGEATGEVAGEVVALQEVMKIGHKKHKKTQKEERQCSYFFGSFRAFCGNDS